MKMARVLCASFSVAQPTGAAVDPAAQGQLNHQAMLACLGLAASYRPDFVVFPEIAAQQQCGDAAARRALAQPIPGPAFAEIAAHARMLNTHVLYGTLERAGRRVYNTAALIGRDGALLGRYRKWHLPDYELAEGVHPGVTVPVWETDLGAVGCAICFDLKYPDIGLALARGGAQLVLWPSMFAGTQRLAAWARDYGFFLAACHAGRGRIVDPAGLTIATEGPPLRCPLEQVRLRFTYADVNLDQRTYHYDHHYDALRQLCAQHGPQVGVRDLFSEGVFNLDCRLPEQTIDDLERQFGLTPLRTYLDRCDAQRARRLRRK